MKKYRLTLVPLAWDLFKKADQLSLFQQYLLISLDWQVIIKLVSLGIMDQMEWLYPDLEEGDHKDIQLWLRPWTAQQSDTQLTVPLLASGVGHQMVPAVGWCLSLLAPFLARFLASFFPPSSYFTKFSDSLSWIDCIPIDVNHTEPNGKVSPTRSFVYLQWNTKQEKKLISTGK